MSLDLDWNASRWVSKDPAPAPELPRPTEPGSGEPLIYTKEFCWNVTDWVGSLLELVATADSLTTWILEPSRFCLTFSVTLTLRRRRVEKPETAGGISHTSIHQKINTHLRSTLSLWGRRGSWRSPGPCPPCHRRSERSPSRAATSSQHPAMTEYEVMFRRQFLGC